MVFSKNGAGSTGCHTENNEYWPISHTICKNKFETDYRPKFVENIEEYLDDLGVGKLFTNKIQKAPSKKGKYVNWTTLK